MFTKGQHRGHGDHWAWRLTGNYWQHLARVHRRVAHLRKSFHWDLARQLCQQYDHITLEALNLRGMKALRGRKVSDLGFAGFVDILH